MKYNNTRNNSIRFCNKCTEIALICAVAAKPTRPWGDREFWKKRGYPKGGDNLKGGGGGGADTPF